MFLRQTRRQKDGKAHSYWLCFTLCGTWAMLHARSRDRIRKNGKISGFGAPAEAKGLDCRARRSWRDRLVGQPRRRGLSNLWYGAQFSVRHVRPHRSLPAQGTSVLIQATRRVAGSPRAPRFTCPKMGCGAIGMARRASARVPHRGVFLNLCGCFGGQPDRGGSLAMLVR